MSAQSVWSFCKPAPLLYLFLFIFVIFFPSCLLVPPTDDTFYSSNITLARFIPPAEKDNFLCTDMSGRIPTRKHLLIISLHATTTSNSACAYVCVEWSLSDYI